ncbi:MAG: DUF1549 domain-containing protein [Planctomycetota bacterium]|nr:DUF1549 domain-containing protein [Planctomycetota bacterium]
MRQLGYPFTLTVWAVAAPALAVATVALAVATPALAVATAGDERFEFFEKKVRPLLVRHCYKCHSANAKKVRGGLFLDSQEGWMNGGDSGPAVNPGKPGESLLIAAVKYEDSDLEMPPRGKLSAEEVRVLVEWVKAGAPDPRTGAASRRLPSKAIDFAEARKFWAFQPPSAPAPSDVEVKDGSWPRSAIDRFVLARAEAKGLRPVRDADRRTLIRRATFDLIGLPPSPGEVDAFLADESPAAFAKVVDRLLSSQRFGERWGRHWLDVVRYAESTGKTRNYPYRHAWRYRDYVIASFNEDKPYDQFLTEQIAGDLLEGATDEQRIATGFLALGTKDLNERNPRQFLMDNVDEQIDTTSRAILAMTVSCARCHDHKFDPIPTRDYYAMAGIFSSTEILAGMTARGRGRQARQDLLISLSPATGAEGEAQENRRQKRVAQLEGQLTRARRQLQSIRNGLKSGAAAKKRRKRQKNAAVEEGGDAATGETATPAEQRVRFKRIRQRIKQLTGELARAKKKGGAPAGPAAMGVRDRTQAVDCKVHVRGEVTNLGAQVPRGFLQVIAGPDLAIRPQSSGRLELARWLTRRENPLTARVMVNRIWHHLFGRGLVRTVDNFGHSGETPSHPLVLDHLARRFQENGWSIKKTIRGILLSRTYQLSSEFDEANHSVDPEDVFLWRMGQRRLQVEALRDAILAVSGGLDLQPPAGSPVMNLNFGEIGRQVRVRAADMDSNHRSVYLPVLRGMIPAIFQVFDFADPSMVKGRRDITTVATQALYLLNSPFVRRESRRTAERLLEQPDLDDATRVDRAYRWALGRPPRADERQRAVSYVTESMKDTGSAREREVVAWAAFCQALFASAEFRYLN